MYKFNFFFFFYLETTICPFEKTFFHKARLTINKTNKLKYKTSTHGLRVLLLSGGVSNPYWKIGLCDTVFILRFNMNKNQAELFNCPELVAFP